MAARNVGVPVNRVKIILFALTANRALAASSKLATGETALGPLQWDGTNYRQATSRKLDAAQNKPQP